MVFADKKWIGCLGLCLFLQSCTQIDDYLLGKDNTPKPTSMAPLSSSQSIKTIWSMPVGKSKHSGNYLKLNPHIQGNTLFIADSTGRVQAIDKNTGKVHWTKTFKQGLVSGPVVSGDYLALGTNNSHVLLLKTQNGDLVWEKSVSGDVLSAPLFVPDALVVKSIDGNVYAFELKTGVRRFVVEHGAPNLILKASASPVKMGNLILVGFSDGKLDAVELATGHVVWQRSISYASGSSDVERLVDIDADPIIKGELVYLASYQGEIGALSLKSGQFLWHKPASTYKNLAYDNNTIYMTDSDDVIWAYEMSSGQVKWKQEGLKARGVTEPVIMGKYVLLGDKTGLLHVINKQNGSFVSRFQQSGAIEVAPTVSGDKIYVLAAGVLSCISLRG